MNKMDNLVKSTSSWERARQQASGILRFVVDVALRVGIPGGAIIILANTGSIEVKKVDAGTIPEPTPTAITTATATVTPSPTKAPSPEITQTPLATVTPDPTETPPPSATPPATETPTPSPTETPIPTPELPPINPRQFYDKLLAHYPFSAVVETECVAPDGSIVSILTEQQTGYVPGYQVTIDNPAALAAAFVLNIMKPTAEFPVNVGEHACKNKDFAVHNEYNVGPSSQATSGALVNLKIANMPDWPPEVDRVPDENPIGVRLFIPKKETIVVRVASKDGEYFLPLSPTGLIVDGVHEFAFPIVLGKDGAFVIDIFEGELPMHVDEGDLLASQELNTELNVPAPLAIGTSQNATITRIEGGQYEQIEVQTFVINDFPALIIRSDSSNTGSFLIDFNPPARSVGMNEGFAFFTAANGILVPVEPPLSANMPYIYGPRDLAGFEFDSMDYRVFLNLVNGN